MTAALLGPGASFLQTPKPSGPLGAAPLGAAPLGGFLLLLVGRTVAWPETGYRRREISALTLSLSLNLRLYLPSGPRNEQAMGPPASPFRPRVSIPGQQPFTSPSLSVSCWATR